jgi:hypothetical protein
MRWPRSLQQRYQGIKDFSADFRTQLSGRGSQDAIAGARHGQREKAKPHAMDLHAPEKKEFVSTA